MKFSQNPFRTDIVKAVEVGLPIRTIDSQLLLTLSSVGRNLLAYIIDKQLANAPNIFLDKVEITRYYSERINPSYANTYNVIRGIKNLLENHVIAESTAPGEYFLNLKLISKDGKGGN